MSNFTRRTFPTSKTCACNGVHIGVESVAIAYGNAGPNCMATLRDVLVWYNNRDAVPFLQAIDKQFAVYKDRDIDLFKNGVSVPGLTLI